MSSNADKKTKTLLLAVISIFAFTGIAYATYAHFNSATADNDSVNNIKSSAVENTEPTGNTEATKNTPKVVSGEKENAIITKDVNQRESLEPITTTIERNDDVEISKDALDSANSIANAVIDTLAAEITQIEQSKDNGMHSVSVDFKWKSDIDVLTTRLSNYFTYERSTYVFRDEFNSVQYSVSKPSEDDPSLEVFNALLETKISLLVVAGDDKKLITIATGHRQKDKTLAYSIFPSNNTQKTILASESIPVTFDNIPHDKFKLLRGVSLGIVLERLDTGRTFRIKLDEKEM